MILKDPDFDRENELESLDQSMLEQYADRLRTNTRRTEVQKIQDICVKIMTDPWHSPKKILLLNIDKVITKVESQISQNCKKPNERNRRQKGPFYYKALADVVESVTGAVTLTCGLNCTQDYLRRIGVLEYDQQHLMERMTELVVKQKEKSQHLDEEFYASRNMKAVERIIGYDFKCKAWLIEALTHKSF